VCRRATVHSVSPWRISQTSGVTTTLISNTASIKICHDGSCALHLRPSDQSPIATRPRDLAVTKTSALCRLPLRASSNSDAAQKRCNRAALCGAHSGFKCLKWSSRTTIQSDFRRLNTLSDKSKSKRSRKLPSAASKNRPEKLKRKDFEERLAKLQTELVKLQLWVQHKGLKVVVIFEGRDAAGKGGVIKRITERVSPRVFRLVALPAPTDREKSQMYVQRYIPHLPAAGEVVVFDRSWYNRAGVEKVMGFCSSEDTTRFLEMCPSWERAMVENGIILIKYWFEVSQQEQTKRFLGRINDGRKIWKLSPMDLESHRRWYDYSRARDDMLLATNTAFAPWYIVNADDKRRARLSCISHLLSLIPYKEIKQQPVKLPKRQKPHGYAEPKNRRYNFVPEVL
jgi:polyphosphate kinase 2